MKYGLVKSKGLAGIGIWALSYEDSGTGMWGSIKSSYSPAGVPDLSRILSIIPNPVSDVSVIRYSIQAREHISLKVFDSSGQLKAILVDREAEPGYYDQDISSTGLSSGIYICVLETRSGRSSLKIAVIKRK
jgi:hypothetical protein